MGDHVLLDDVFLYDRAHDELIRTDIPYYLAEKLAFLIGSKKGDVLKEIETRMAVLSTLVKNKVTDYEDIHKVVLDYYKDPNKVLKELGLL